MCIMQDSLPVYIWTLVAALVHFHVNLYHRSDSTLVTISAHTCASRWSSARRHHQSMETGSCRTPDTNARPTSPTGPRPICHFSTRHDLFFTNISHFWKSIRHACLTLLFLLFTSHLHVETLFCGDVAFCILTWFVSGLRVCAKYFQICLISRD